MRSDIFNNDLYVTFSDVLLLPGYSEVVPADVNISVSLLPGIDLAMPIISAAMDTVTDWNMALTIARLGGIGCIHKNFSIQEQSQSIAKVKRFESCVIDDPICVRETDTVDFVIKTMITHGISGVPVLNSEKKIVGIATNRDTKFVEKPDQKILDVMTKNVVTVPKNFSTSTVKSLFIKHKIEKIIIEDNGECIGMITAKDLEKSKKYPLATNDKNGRLAVAAAVGVGEAELVRVQELIVAGCDVIVVDTAHGHSFGVIDMVKKIRAKYDIPIIAGNIATSEGVQALAKAGANVIKVGIGPGSICTTRIVSGVGVPQLSAIYHCSNEAKKYGVSVIADGGIRTSGDIVKALAAGANCVMLGSLLAGTDETPGKIAMYNGITYKEYRGMGSIGAMANGSADRYLQSGVEKNKLVPEGIEGVVPYKGYVGDVLHQIAGGIRSGMGYIGAKNIAELQTKAKFIRITDAGLKESHPHNIKIVKDTNWDT